MVVRSDTAASSAFGLSSASPIPMLTTTLVMRGTCMIFLRSNALRRAGTTSLLYFSCILFITFTPRLIDQRLTIFAHAPSPIFIALNFHAGRLAALWTDQHHIRNIDLAFELDAARVDVTTSLGLDLFLVLGANVHTLNNHAALIQEHIDDFSALALVFQAATNDFDGIAFANLDSHI